MQQSAETLRPLQIAPEFRFQGQRESSPEGGALLRGHVEALTPARNKRKIRTAYRIKNMQSPEQAVPGGEFGHNMHSGVKSRKVNL